MNSSRNSNLRATSRRARVVSSIVLLLALSTLACGVPSAAPDGKRPTAAASAKANPAVPANAAHAYLAGGCFWCVETAFEGVPGVLGVVSGFTGGPEKNPTYEQVSSGDAGHLEAVDVAYDASRVSYEKLLDIFWHNIDPTQSDGQFCDRGPQYRSAIFYRDEAQKLAAVRSKQAIEASHVLKSPIVTQILAAGAYWPAEDYHQDFWKKDPIRYKSYRFGCGRDQRLDQLWGKDARRGSPKH
ncbi:MAG: peptide-methionine (S)-S-oxide reductase MsrA [Candidatus Eisenbacteria bacterium]|uniref:Peptide methionine sulfoxide reductase MsrA n=1 Tax=Eiseniibacteriota bacterium TaxID=2212470 RepID=A0A849SGG4_UNCEI|nr:peptide-methionine (S)-S-oxide reductase MsrA [Candidatus Eisenbacteria bacterium]